MAYTIQTNSKMTIKVLTYNVLSHKLARPTHFTKCPSQDLIPAVRYKRVIKKLDYSIKENHIICLQEVSHEWRSRFTSYFESNNYHFSCVNYSKPMTGYMGVGIAYPRDKYILKDMYIKTVSDLKRWPQYSHTTTDTLKSWAFWTPLPTYYSWNYMKNKSNQIICMALEVKNTKKEFLVANYHMPCAFSYDDIMVSHVAMCMKYIHDISGGLPCIFAGDFNGQPFSKVYKYVTEGVYDDSIFEGFPSSDKWRPQKTPTYLFKSSHNEVNKLEPNYTNYTFSKGSMFKGCLDYIFYKGDIKPTFSHVISASRDLQPSKKEPSDHLALVSHFEFLSDVHTDLTKDIEKEQEKEQVKQEIEEDKE